MKMRGVISQGMVMTMDSLGLKPDKYEVGADVAGLLGITKIQTEEERRLTVSEADKREERIRQRHKKFYQSRLGKRLMRYKFTRKIILFLFGGKKYKPLAFPNWITKTDEVRCENVPHELDNKKPLYAHEKIDGTSTTFGLWRKGRRKFDFAVCSRNIRQLSYKQACFFGEDNPYWEMALKYSIEDKMRTYAIANDLNTLVVQGETVGYKLQGNPYRLEGRELYVFNFICDGKRMDSREGAKIVESWGMKWVPLLCDNFICPDTMEELKKFADGQSVLNPDTIREGCIYRDSANTRSFKNVSNLYLLGKNE